MGRLRAGGWRIGRCEPADQTLACLERYSTRVKTRQGRGRIGENTAIGQERKQRRHRAIARASDRTPVTGFFVVVVPTGSVHRAGRAVRRAHRTMRGRGFSVGVGVWVALGFRLAGHRVLDRATRSRHQGRE